MHLPWTRGIGELGKRPWNPRTDQWPPFSLGSRYTREKWLSEIQQEFGNRSWDEGRKVFQEAIGSLADWRGARSIPLGSYAKSGVMVRTNATCSHWTPPTPK